NLHKTSPSLRNINCSPDFVLSHYEVTISKEGTEIYSLISRNCILHKIAWDHQDAICHGLHDRIMQKTLGGRVNADVELKECIALGNNYSRHIITNKSVEAKDKAS
ncbi:MAG TPA: hypothetical protein VFI73_00875, partial [Candidatus Nitrosopolaris sp.]|nr:hypothetical protein [Candidatus Nitrosopolaris sp.]